MIASPTFTDRAFVLRTPLLPLAELIAWSAELTAAEAIARGHDDVAVNAAHEQDRRVLRERLLRLVERPEMREALWLASPSLFGDLDLWQRAPDSKGGRRVERAVVRYFARTAGRATPFGLFAGVTPGEVGAVTRLELAGRHAARRHTRLDMDYLFALAAALNRDPALRRELRFWPNSSLRHHAGRWRYVEARLVDSVRSHHLVTVEPSPYLDAALARAAEGARLDELAAAVAAADPNREVSQEEALDFIEELIDSQLLVSALEPTVTGPDALTDLRQTLASLPAPALAARLGEVERTLETIDAGGVGIDPDRYVGLAEHLSGLPVKPRLARLFQVDLYPRAEALSLSEAVVAELARGAEILRRLFGRPSADPLRSFREAFTQRWGELHEVPLIEALDEETGLGLDADRGGDRDAAPLLAGLPFSDPPEPTARWSPFEAVMLARLEAVWRGRTGEIELSPDDVDRLALPDAAPLPDAFHVTAALAAPTAEAVDRGEFDLLLIHASGPSGARMIGRFCHGEPRVWAAVKEHLRHEEALDPEAVFAEIVHLPEGRVGNVLGRPRLRDWEIPYLGRSGAPPDRQLPVSDLTVSVINGRVVLRSRRLGRRVVPRLTTAHNFDDRGLTVYRFLGALQQQGLAFGVMWTWGALASAPNLPRVRIGRLVLSRRRWRAVAEEIADLVRAHGVDRLRALARWRAARDLPRWVSWLEPGSRHELFVDLENPLLVDAWLDRVRGHEEMVLLERFPGPGELPVHGPEGAYVHEFVVPFVRAVEPAAMPRPRSPAVTTPAIARSFPPGSEWLYAKLYAGPACCDRVLQEAVAPLVADLLASGVADSWFFLRYGDPDWHLRVRFHGAPKALARVALPALHSAIEPLLADRTVTRLQLDTYNREIERYGGLAAIGWAERAFFVDSEAVATLLAPLHDDAGAVERWRLTLVGVDRLLRDLGLDEEARIELISRLRDSFAAELGGGKPMQLAIDRRYRVERSVIDSALAAPDPPALATRSPRLAPVVAALDELEARRELACSRADLAASLVHLHVNRMIRFDARVHERMIYDFLARSYESHRARAIKK